jgi:sugar lactone lactonase YvrE
MLKYDPVMNSSKLLIDDIFMANGIALPETEDFVLMCESGFNKIWKYYLKGKKVG